MSSMMADGTSDLDQRIAARVRQLRSARGLSLEALAAESGVSRSMISLVERGESSPTAVVLEKLGRGLGVTLAALLESPAPEDVAAPSPLVRRDEQLGWRDPASGYRRRTLTPPGSDQPLALAEVTFPPRARVAFDNGHLGPLVFQQVWLLEGTMAIAHGKDTYTLREGDCLMMDLSSPTSFHNPGRKAARYLVATASSGARTGAGARRGGRSS